MRHHNSIPVVEEDMPSRKESCELRVEPCMEEMLEEMLEESIMLMDFSISSSGDLRYCTVL